MQILQHKHWMSVVLWFVVVLWMVLCGGRGTPTCPFAAVAYTTRSFACRFSLLQNPHRHIVYPTSTGTNNWIRVHSFRNSQTGCSVNGGLSDTLSPTTREVPVPSSQHNKVNVVSVEVRAKQKQHEAIVQQSTVPTTGTSNNKQKVTKAAARKTAKTRKSKKQFQIGSSGQTKTETKKLRHIQRRPIGGGSNKIASITDDKSSNPFVARPKMSEDSPLSTPPSTIPTLASVVDNAPQDATTKTSLTTTNQTSKWGDGSHPVDDDIVVAGKVVSQYEVVKACSSGSDDLWYDAVLNQCDVDQNINKYYRLQVLKLAGSGDSGPFYTWFKSGRVGEAGTKSFTDWSGPYEAERDATSAFRKKYSEKRGNAFGHLNFVAKRNMYVPVEMDNDVCANDRALLVLNQRHAKGKPIKYMKSALDPKTMELVAVLFSKEMRSEALTSFNLDLKRLPLGVPSKAQIEHGIAILGEIEDKLNGVPSTTDGAASTYEQLSSRFYTAIPHAFGSSVPPTISTKKSLQGRYDMCNILLDMYQTSETVGSIETSNKVTAKKLVPHPVDQFYASLKADLTPIEQNSPEEKMIRQYFDLTKNSNSGDILDVWSVNRHGEQERFAAYDAMGNRWLLWHGTKIAVVAPIIKMGLRILPHSRGRVGSGIYMSNLQQASAEYTTGYSNKFGCIFLCEVPMGKTHVIHRDGYETWGLRAAPAGYDSVQAVGKLQPKSTATFPIDGKDVTVPNSNAEPSGVEWGNFNHDEFIVYNEAQIRLRYVVTMKL